MISCQDAYRQVLEQVENFGQEQITLDQALGRVLAEDLHADRDFPAFDRVCMDGIAINSAGFKANRRSFVIQSMQAAGKPQQTLRSIDECIEVATGAILPENTDSVIRYEDIDIKGGVAYLNDDTKLLANIHYQGSDCTKGSCVLTKNKLITPADIAVLATIGQAKVEVRKLPKIAIITTGDELVNVDQQPKNYQIRKSNVHVLSALLSAHSIRADAFHIRDDDHNIESGLTSLLDRYDVLLLSGAVSKGRYDFLPTVLQKLGVKKLFHFVAQRPGKPFWFGKSGPKTIFAFPGNPVSTTVCFLKYCRPWINACLGLSNKTFSVRLADDVHFKPHLSYFAQARITIDAQGQCLAQISHGNGSGDLLHLSQMDGFVQLPPEKSLFSRGSVYPFIPLHPIFVP